MRSATPKEMDRLMSLALSLFLLCSLLTRVEFVKGEEHLDKPKVKTFHVTTDIRYHFAVTMVSSELHNPQDEAAEVTFDATLSDESFISNFTLEIDGSIFPGNVKEKEQSKKDYETAKKKGQSAGHIAARPRQSYNFVIRVNVAALSSVVFNLTCSEVLKRTLGVYEHINYLDPGQPVEDMMVTVTILEFRPLKFVNVLPLKNELLTNSDIAETSERNDNAIVSQPTPETAKIVYTPTWEQQVESSPDGICALFTVRYDIERDYDATDLLVVNGYFVHFIAPKIEQSIRKDIIFILDKSDSMKGVKLVQLKDAMRVILKDLSENDRFNILAFEWYADAWRTKMVPVTEKNINAALRFNDEISVGGSTNIDGALKKGLKILNSEKKEGSLQAVIFFSGDLPNYGIKEREEIVSNMIIENQGKIPIYSLAFGGGAGCILTQQLASKTRALARCIYEDADASLQLTHFYKEVSTTLLSDVKVTYLENHVDKESLTESTFGNFFNGSEIVVAGKLVSNIDTLRVKVSADSSEGQITLILESDVLNISAMEPLKSFPNFWNITEKMWAYLTIKEIIKKMDDTEDVKEREALKAKATTLSLQHNFVTPLTSMVVTKPDEELLGDLQDLQGQNGMKKEIEKSESNPGSSPPTSSSRHYGSDGDSDDGGDNETDYGGGDPHFMMSVGGIPHPICFDVIGEDKRAYNLLKDPVSGLTVNMKLGNGNTLNKKGQLRSYMMEIVIYQGDFLIRASLQRIKIKKDEVSWNSKAKIHFQMVAIILNRLQFQVRFPSGIVIKVSKLIRHMEVPMRADFLNVEIENESMLSPGATGIMGQFAHKYVMMKEAVLKNGRHKYKLFNIENGEIHGMGMGHRHTKKDLLTGEERICIVIDYNQHLFLNTKDIFMIPNVTH